MRAHEERIAPAWRRTLIIWRARPFRRRVVRSRLHGYEDALRQAAIEPEEDLVVEADWTPGRAADATRLLLHRQPQITAIFVHNDTMPVGVPNQRMNINFAEGIGIAKVFF